MRGRTPKLARGVALVGAGMSKFGAFPDKTTRDLFVEAFNAMAKSVDKGLDSNDIEALYVGNFSSDLFEGQGHVAPIMADWVGLVPKPATRVEDACAASGVALREGVIAVASGLYDVVLVGGTEKMTNLPTERVTDTLAAASDAVYEASCGFTFPGLYAAIATAYMAKYGATVETFMKVGIKNHNNGALNPKAQFNKSIRDLMNSRIAKAEQKGEPAPDWKDELDFLKDPKANTVVSWPMRLLLVAEDLAKDFCNDPLYIAGTGQGSDHALHEREDMTTILAARTAARQAYEMSGLTPNDIQIAEVHDCFTIAEIVASEDLGFFPPGEGYKAAEQGVTARDGAKPINTSGGLKSKGHPVGASGAGQVVEIWTQMRGEAGPRQVPNKEIRIGLTHNVGATGGTCAVHIFQRR
jgi:acetyl-CoA C-acetyltransferase